MQFTQEKIKLTNAIDGFSGQNLLDVNTTITHSLERSELHIYSRAIGKVLNKDTLNRDDLKVLDKIDALTYEKHGMCLKDADITDLEAFNAMEEIAEKKFNWCIRDEQVQIARKNASEKLGVKFVDLSIVAFH